MKKYIYRVSLLGGERTYAADSHDELLGLLGLDKKKCSIKLPTKFKNEAFGQVFSKGSDGHSKIYHIEVLTIKGSLLEVLLEPIEELPLKINVTKSKYLEAIRERFKGETNLHRLVSIIGGGHDAYDYNQEKQWSPV